MRNMFAALRCWSSSVARSSQRSTVAFVFKRTRECGRFGERRYDQVSTQRQIVSGVSPCVSPVSRDTVDTRRHYQGVTLNRPRKTMRGLFLMQRVVKRDAEGYQYPYR
jgi:hypothetical protein